jgi:hypothetical protein
MCSAFNTALYCYFIIVRLKQTLPKNDINVQESKCQSRSALGRTRPYLPTIWRREASLVRPGLGLVAVVGRPGAIVLRGGREGVSKLEVHRTPHDGH